MLHTKTTLSIFRDCLKIIPRMVTEGNKIQATRALLRKQFQRNKDQVDSEKIHLLKMNAVKGISNYLIYTIQLQHKINPNRAVFQPEDQEEQIEEQQIQQQIQRQQFRQQLQNRNRIR